MQTLPATVLVVFIATVLSFPARADWRFDAETGAIYNSNLSNSDKTADIKDDWAWRSDLRLGNGFQLTRDLRLNLGIQFREQLWTDFYEFDTVAPGGDIGLRYRFGLGPRAPWMVVEDNLWYAFVHDNDRSGLDNQLRVRAGVAITSWLAAEASYIFDHYAAKDEFWDLQGHSGAVRLIFTATSALQFAIEYRYRNGQVISYARPPRPDILALTSQRESVTSFGFPFYTAYHLRGATNEVSLSASYTLTRYLSLQASYEFRDTTDGPLQYVNHLVEAKVAFAY